MAGQDFHRLGIQHLGLGAEGFLELAVVDARVAPRHYQHGVCADAEGQRLGDAPGLNAMGLGGQGHGGGARLQFDDVDFGRLPGEEGADRFKAHGRSPG
ncbi:hypothetical protein D3C76_1591040 [compost metagenome]